MMNSNVVNSKFPLIFINRKFSVMDYHSINCEHFFFISILQRKVGGLNPQTCSWNSLINHRLSLVIMYEIYLMDIRCVCKISHIFIGRKLIKSLICVGNTYTPISISSLPFLLFIYFCDFCLFMLQKLSRGWQLF